MQNDQRILIEFSEKETANQIHLEIETTPNAKCKIIDRKNLDGDAATWIIIATLTTQMLPHILSFITNFFGTSILRPKLPTKIIVGEVEIENPTEADLKWLRKHFTPKSNSENNDG